MAEVTLADLVAWEPRLTAVGTAGRGPEPVNGNGLVERWSERELSWAVAARATAPMLPLLRGGELVILPGRVLTEAGVSLPILLRELVSHDVVGVVLDAPPDGTIPLPVLVAEGAGPELEGEINRLLTQRRGEIYRAGTELGRLLANLTAGDADLPTVLNAAAEALGVPAAVVDGRGGTAAATTSEALPGRGPGTGGPTGERGWRGDRLAVPLAGGATLWLGPAPRPLRALIRVASERIAVAAEAAIVRAAQARPRGAARAGAIAALLAASPAEAARMARMVGLPAEGHYRVALTPVDSDTSAPHRALAPLGTVHDAGFVAGRSAAVIELRDVPPGRLPGGGRRPGPPDLGPVAGKRLALSGPVAGTAALPEAARQAGFAAALLDAGLIRGSTARFDAVSDLGPYRLLYRLWGTPDLAAFIEQALGDLPTRDRRGTLRRTLLAYLAAGGSHVEAAARLGIHRNTLAYRLKQIAALTGREPADPDTRLVLHLALLAGTLPPAPGEAGQDPVSRS